MVIKLADDSFAFDSNRPFSIGKIHSYYGSFMAFLRAYLFILYYGKENLAQIAENAVLNANYVRVALQPYIDSAYDEICMHECVMSAKRQKRHNGIRAIDIAKRLMDYGYHPPTVYFPLIAPEALMIEPTETESKETLDEFISAMRSIMLEAAEQPELLRNAPTVTPVRRLDEKNASKDVRWICGPNCETV